MPFRVLCFFWRLWIYYCADAVTVTWNVADVF